ncbi:MAG: hypothetical protein KBD56_05580 [Candidatus Eisenbacteria bacterium]|nr:hypothetical protein [Candidatus Eisenbacteria bacterium]
MNRTRRMFGWFPFAWAVMALIAGGFVAGCGDDGDEDASFDPPGNLTYTNGNNQVTLAWSGSGSEGDEAFAGYDVFRSETTMADLDLEGWAAHKLNADPLTVRGYVDATAQNGTKYFYAVRSVKTNGDWSRPTAEVDTAPVVRGGTELIAEFADNSRPSGFDLSEGDPVAVSSSDPDNRMLVDFYLGTAGDNDEPVSGTSGQLAIKSPNLVLNGNPNWNQRLAQFQVLPSEDASTVDSNVWQNMILLGTTEQQIESKVIAVRTPPDAEGEVHYGKIVIYDATINLLGQRSIEIFYTYQVVPNYVRF